MIYYEVELRKLRLETGNSFFPKLFFRINAGMTPLHGTTQKIGSDSKLVVDDVCSDSS